MDWLGLFEHLFAEHFSGNGVDGGVVALMHGQSTAPKAEQRLANATGFHYSVTEFVGLSVRHLFDKLL